MTWRLLIRRARVIQAGRLTLWRLEPYDASMPPTGAKNVTGDGTASRSRVGGTRQAVEEGPWQRRRARAMHAHAAGHETPENPPPTWATHGTSPSANALTNGRAAAAWGRSRRTKTSARFALPHLIALPAWLLIKQTAGRTAGSRCAAPRAAACETPRSLKRTLLGLLRATSPPGRACGDLLCAIFFITVSAGMACILSVVAEA